MAVKEGVYQRQCWLELYPQWVVSRQYMRRALSLNKAMECHHQLPFSKPFTPKTEESFTSEILAFGMGRRTDQLLQNSVATPSHHYHT